MAKFVAIPRATFSDAQPSLDWHFWSLRNEESVFYRAGGVFRDRCVCAGCAGPTGCTDHEDRAGCEDSTARAASVSSAVRGDCRRLFFLARPEQQLHSELQFERGRRVARVFLHQTYRSQSRFSGLRKTYPQLRGSGNDSGLQQSDKLPDFRGRHHVYLHRGPGHEIPRETRQPICGGDVRGSAQQRLRRHLQELLRQPGMYQPEQNAEQQRVRFHHRRRRGHPVQRTHRHPYSAG